MFSGIEWKPKEKRDERHKVFLVKVELMPNILLTNWGERYCACVLSKLVQFCSTLYSPMDCRAPGSSVHEIFQARILEWVAVSSSKGSS